MKKLVTFLAGHGSPLVFTVFLWSILFGESVFGFTWYSTGFAQYDLLVVIGVTLAYLWLQGIAAAWGDVGGDTGAILDLLFSVIPLFPIILHLYGNIDSAKWEIIGITSAIILYDLVVNTKIIFKIARLTSELATAGR